MVVAIQLLSKLFYCCCQIHSYARVLGARISQCLCTQLSMLPVLEPPFLLLDHTPDNPNQGTNTGNESGISCLEDACKLLSEQEPVTLARSIADGQYIMELEGYPL